MTEHFLTEYRCPCGKLLLKGIFFDASLEIKCKKCGVINTIQKLKLANDDSRYILIVNDQGLYVNASESACTILGYTHDELIGKHISLINKSLPKEMGERLFGSKSVLCENNNIKLDSFHTTKSGKVLPVTIYMRLHISGCNNRQVIVLVEVKKSTGENNVKNKIKATEFLDSSCDFYLDIDKNGILEYVSPTIEKIFGFSQETLTGKNYFDFNPSESREKDKEMFEYFSSIEQPYRLDYHNRKDVIGNNIYSQLYFTPTFCDHGTFTGYRVLGWVVNKT